MLDCLAVRGVDPLIEADSDMLNLAPSGVGQELRRVCLGEVVAQSLGVLGSELRKPDGLALEICGKPLQDL
eukprot:15017154-Heterocapsa_arctica.AAC.1